MDYFHILVFLSSVFLMAISSKWVIFSLERISRFLGWKEFVVAFFVMSATSSLPNLFVGMNSAFKKIPQLSFGDVAGNNLVALSLAVALSVIFAKNKELSVESKTVRTTSNFTFTSALLPLILTLDGNLSRAEGFLLICFFIFYVSWLFSKKERFIKEYKNFDTLTFKSFKTFLKDLGLIIIGVVLLLIAAQGIVSSAELFAQKLNVSIVLIGVLITGLGNALPEIYFSVIAAKKGETWMILGNLMGSVIVPATLVLGIVSLINPISINDFSPFAISRIFLMISALFFIIFLRTNQKITLKEGLFLLGIYLAFLLIEIIFK